MNTRLRYRSLLSILLLALLAPLGLYAPPIQASTTVTDDLNDFSKMFSHSANLTFDTSTSCCGTDPKRLDRTSKTVETVI